MLQGVAVICVVLALAIMGSTAPAAPVSLDAGERQASRHHGLSHQGRSLLFTNKKNLGSSGGHWDACTHLQGYGMNYDHGLGRFLAYLFPAKTALEFGCGIGLYADFIHRFGNVDKVHCLEPSPMIFPASIFKHDTINNILASPTQITYNVISEEGDEAARRAFEGMEDKYDLVYSIEVLEHIPRELHGKVADFLVSKTRHLLVFSAARPGQGGTGHIAERDQSEWHDEFTSRGLVYMPLLTQTIRHVCDRRNVNHWKNLMVFRAADANDIEDQIVRKHNVMIPSPDQRDKLMWPKLYEYSEKLHSRQMDCEEFVSQPDE